MATFLIARIPKSIFPPLGGSSKPRIPADGDRGRDRPVATGRDVGAAGEGAAFERGTRAARVRSVGCERFLAACRQEVDREKVRSRISGGSVTAGACHGPERERRDSTRRDARCRFRSCAD